jgi:hypothetical protein
VRLGLITPSSRFILILMLASAVLVAGCTEQPVPGSASQAGAPPAGFNASVAQAAARSVLTTSAASLREGWYIYRAEQRLVVGCMKNLGARYIIASAGPEPPAQATTASVVGNSHPATYGVSVAGAQRSAEPAEDRYVAGLPPTRRARYTEALNGSPHAVGTLTLPGHLNAGYETGGCVGAARRALFGSVRMQALDALFPQDVDHSFAAFLAGRRAYLSALRGWQHCMAATGSHLASPQAAIQAIEALAAKKGTSRAELSTRQTQVAGADAVCNTQSGLRMRMADALAEFVRMLPHSELLQLQRIYISHREAVRTAIHDLSR